MENLDYTSIIVRIDVFGHKGKAIMTYENEKLRNMELYLSRKGSFLFGMLSIVSKVISTGLRKKIPLNAILEDLKEVSPFDPAGFTHLHKNTPAESFAEYLAALLTKYYKYPTVLNGEAQQV